MDELPEAIIIFNDSRASCFRLLLLWLLLLEAAADTSMEQHKRNKHTLAPSLNSSPPNLLNDDFSIFGLRKFC